MKFCVVVFWHATTNRILCLEAWTRDTFEITNDLRIKSNMVSFLVSKQFNIPAFG